MNKLTYSRHICLLLLVVLFSLETSAQAKSDQQFKFVYVAHDMSSMEIGNENALRNSLDQMKRDLAQVRDDSPTLFYLSNGISYYKKDSIRSNVRVYENDVAFDTIRTGKPIVVKYDKKDPKSDEEWANVFLSELLNTISHDVNTDIDLENILYILESADFVDEYGRMEYGEVSFDFFVNQKFWEQGLHEKLIAGLYFILDAKQFDSRRFRFNIHHLIQDEAKRPEYWKKQQASFGLWNVDDINNSYPKVQLMK